MSEDDSNLDRLHKRIAASGLCSRRAAEELIRQGRVQVNGETVREMGLKVGPDDAVLVDGIPLKTQRMVYLVMNKPNGVVTTMSDPRRRKTVAQLLPASDVVVKPVGRLDMDSEGVLLFTNDGELANRLTHPRYGVDKEYVATVQGLPSDEALERLRKGVYIEGGKTAPAKVEVVHAHRDGVSAVLRLVIHEGRNRQVRLMCEAVGHVVTELKRTKFGPITAFKLPRGACRVLGQVEVDRLRELVGLPPEGTAKPKRRSSSSASQSKRTPRTSGPKRK